MKNECECGRCKPDLSTVEGYARSMDYVVRPIWPYTELVGEPCTCAERHYWGKKYGIRILSCDCQPEGSQEQKRHWEIE